MKLSDQIETITSDTLHYLDMIDSLRQYPYGYFKVLKSVADTAIGVLLLPFRKIPAGARTDAEILEIARASLNLGKIGPVKGFARKARKRSDIYEKLLTRILAPHTIGLRPLQRGGPIRAMLIQMLGDTDILISPRYKGRGRLALAMNELGHLRLGHTGDLLEYLSEERSVEAKHRRQEYEANRFSDLCMQLIDAHLATHPHRLRRALHTIPAR